MILYDQVIAEIEGQTADGKAWGRPIKIMSAAHEVRRQVAAALELDVPLLITVTNGRVVVEKVGN